MSTESSHGFVITRARRRGEVQGGEDGYERSTIENWFKEHNTDPKTNVVLTPAEKKLTPNHCLRQAIEAHIAAQKLPE